MSTEVLDLLRARALANAASDEDTPGDLYVIAAAAELQAEILTARDQLLSRVAGSAHDGAAEVRPAPAPVEAAAPTEDPAPVAVPTESAAVEVDPAPAAQDPAPAPAPAPEDADAAA